MSYEERGLCQLACGLIERSIQKYVCKSSKVSIKKLTEYLRRWKQILPNTLKRSMYLGTDIVVI
jgi:hypothetical protein